MTVTCRPFWHLDERLKIGRFHPENGDLRGWACRNDAVIAVAEMMADEALGGATLVVGGGAATKTVLDDLGIN